MLWQESPGSCLSGCAIHFSHPQLATVIPVTALSLLLARPHSERRSCDIHLFPVADRGPRFLSLACLIHVLGEVSMELTGDIEAGGHAALHHQERQTEWRGLCFSLKVEK